MDPRKEGDIVEKTPPNSIPAGQYDDNYIGRKFTRKVIYQEPFEGVLDELVKRYKNGASVRGLAADYGLPERAIRTYMKSIGEPSNGPYRIPKKIRKPNNSGKRAYLAQEALKLRREGASYNYIGEKLGIYSMQVWRIIRQYGDEEDFQGWS